MSSIVVDPRGSATNVAAISCQEVSETTAIQDRGRELPDLWFARMCRDLWQFKVAAHLHFVTLRSDRTCRAWAAGDNDANATTLAQLLRTEDGPRVLKWVMDGCDAEWWAKLQRAREGLSVFN